MKPSQTPPPQLDLFQLPSTTPITTSILPTAATPSGASGLAGAAPKIAPSVHSTDIAIIRRQQQHLQCWHNGALATLTAYRLRQMLKPLWKKDGLPDGSFAVKAAQASLSITSTTPEESVWLYTHMSGVMEAVFSISGLLKMTHDCQDVFFTHDHKRRVYRLGLLMVEKSNGDWSAWRNETVSDADMALMEASIGRGIEGAMATWGIKADAKVRLIDAGEPMVFAPTDGPRAVCRKNVRFILDAATPHFFFLKHPLSYVGLNRVSFAGDL